MRVARNFWKENDENCHYLALYMIYDVTTMQLPKVCFELPKIRTILEQCKNNESRFSFWDQGKFHQIVKISQWNNIYLWNFKKAINFYQSDEKKILDTHQDVNGNVFFEKNLQDWAKIFRNGRSCSDVDVAGPSIPTQSEWIDSEEDDSRDNFDLLTSSAAPFVGEKKLCPLDIWLENWFSRTEWKKKIIQIYINLILYGSIFPFKNSESDDEAHAIDDEQFLRPGNDWVSKMKNMFKITKLIFTAEKKTFVCYLTFNTLTNLPILCEM